MCRREKLTHTCFPETWPSGSSWLEQHRSWGEWRLCESRPRADVWCENWRPYIVRSHEVCEACKANLDNIPDREHLTARVKTRLDDLRVPLAKNEQPRSASPPKVPNGGSGASQEEQAAATPNTVGTPLQNPVDIERAYRQSLWHFQQQHGCRIDAFEKDALTKDSRHRIRAEEQASKAVKEVISSTKRFINPATLQIQPEEEQQPIDEIRDLPSNVAPPNCEMETFQDFQQRCHDAAVVDDEDVARWWREAFEQAEMEM